MSQHAITTATITAIRLDGRWEGCQRIWAIAVISLMLVTWKLWIPISEFPTVPMIDLPADVIWIDRFVVAVLLTSLAWIAIRRRPSRVAFAVCLGSMLLTFVANQHRLQPWAYQAALYSLAFAVLPPRSARWWLMMLSTSIYFYSACGKFDYQFLHTVGQDFIAPVFGSAADEIPQWRLFAAACLPAAELAMAIALVVPVTRRAAGIGVMAFHTVMILMLSPLYLDHSLGVLLWNAWMIAAAWQWFVSTATDQSRNICPGVSEGVETRMTPLSEPMAKAVLCAALLLPLLERTGYWDHWLSWSLYSPHTSRAEIELHESAVSSLPITAQHCLSANENDGGWHSLAIDRWSLQSVGVPLYPQARFELGVAQSIARSLPMDDAIRVKLRSASDRWRGTRNEIWLRSRSEIHRAASQYWLLGSQDLDHSTKP